MNHAERLDRIEIQIEKQNEGIRGLIVVARTCLDSFQELRDVNLAAAVRHDREMSELRESQKQTDEKLNILIATVDRIIRNKDA